MRCVEINRDEIIGSKRNRNRSKKTTTVLLKNTVAVVCYSLLSRLPPNVILFFVFPTVVATREATRIVAAIHQILVKTLYSLFFTQRAKAEVVVGDHLGHHYHWTNICLFHKRLVLKVLRKKLHSLTSPSPSCRSAGRHPSCSGSEPCGPAGHSTDRWQRHSGESPRYQSSRRHRSRTTHVRWQAR